MRRKRSLASMLLELATVLLVTALAFAWGKQVVQATVLASWALSIQEMEDAV